MASKDKIPPSSEFIEKVYEIAFGDNAFNRGFDADEVLVQLREFSDNALKASKDKIPLPSDQYIELTCDLADWIMQERYKGNYKRYIYTDEYDTINYTNKGQDIFNGLIGAVEIVLEDRADIVNAESEREENE